MRVFFASTLWLEISQWVSKESGSAGITVLGSQCCAELGPASVPSALQ